MRKRQRWTKCPGWDSNPHGHEGPRFLRALRLACSGTRAHLSIGPPTPDVPTSVSVRLCMAVGAEQSEVGQAIVLSTAVHVVQLERNRLSVPLMSSAPLTPRLLQALRDQTTPELGGLHESAENKDVLDWCRGDNGFGLPRPPSHASEVGSVQTEASNPRFQVGLTPSALTDAEFTKHAGKGS